MKKTFLILFIVSSVIYAGKATHLVIAEIYAAGGNTGATYKYDYIVLYNPTLSPVDLSTWSIQYAAATAGSAYSVTNLSGSISAGSYYLIKMASGGAVGSELPITPNVTGTTNLSATAGKVALVNDQNSIADKSDANVIDFVGYGGSPSEYEGSAKATYPSNTTKSLCRKDDNGNSTYGSNGSGWDTDDNSADFFQNSAPSPLPVELTSFTSNVVDNKVTLNWSTATEVNNYGFEIQRIAVSDQRSAWEKIGFVQGHGNSNSTKNYSFTDKPTGGIEFQYRLKQIDFNGAFEYSEITSAILENVNEFKLEQNFPNPFNPTTRISYTLPVRTNVRLRVYDILAQVVAELTNGNQEAGRYEVTFDGSNLPSGAYFYKLEAGNYVEVKKLLLVK